MNAERLGGMPETDRQFYPTPPSVAEKMLAGIDWKLIETVLEPEAGKGVVSYKPWDERRRGMKELNSGKPVKDMTVTECKAYCAEFRRVNGYACETKGCMLAERHICYDYVSEWDDTKTPFLTDEELRICEAAGAEYVTRNDSRVDQHWTVQLWKRKPVKVYGHWENRFDIEKDYTRFTPDDCVSCIGTWDGREHNTFIKYPYSPGKGHRYGDVLYVREAWKSATIDPAGGGYALQDIFLYKADEPIDETGMMVEGQWHSPITMPAYAARLFLLVVDVRVERLQDLTNLREEGVKTSEGCDLCFSINKCCRPQDSACGCDNEVNEFAEMWDEGIKQTDQAVYGWDANPWVWVIKIRKISKEAARA